MLLYHSIALCSIILTCGIASRSLRDDGKLTSIYNNSTTLDNQTDDDTKIDPVHSRVLLPPFDYDNSTGSSWLILEHNSSDATGQFNYRALEYYNESMVENNTITFIFRTDQVSLAFSNGRTIAPGLLVFLPNVPEDIDIHDAVEQSVTQHPGTFDLVPPLMVVKSFCPDNDCMNQIVELNIDENKCCIQCTCSNLCPVPESFKPYSRPTTHPGEAVLCTYNSVGDIDMTAGSLGVVTHYLCEDLTNSELVQKCESSTTFMDLRQHIPVYGSIKKRHYYNVYCAQCNNEIVQEMYSWQRKSITPWTISLICKDARFLIEQLNEILVKPSFIYSLSFVHGCYIQWSPKANSTQCALRQRLIDSCLNDSFTDANVKRLCGTIESPVRGRLGMYLNLYCLICNEGYSSYEDKCYSDFEDIHENLYDIRTRKYRVMLQVPKMVVDLIAESILANSSKPKESYANVGMVQVCPITSMTVEGKCINVINELRGFSLDFIFKGIVPAVYRAKYKRSEILSEIRSIVDVGGNGSTICIEHTLATKKDEKNIEVVVQLTSMVNGLIDIKQEYGRVKQRLVEFSNAVNASFLSTLEFYPSPLEMIEDGLVTFAVFTDTIESPDCGRSIAMTDLQFCNACLFNNFEHLNNDMIEIDNVRFMAGEYLIKTGANQSALICCELYRSRSNTTDSLVGSGSRMIGSGSRMIGSGSRMMPSHLQIVVMMLSLFRSVGLFTI